MSEFTWKSLLAHSIPLAFLLGTAGMASAEASEVNSLPEQPVSIDSAKNNPGNPVINLTTSTQTANLELSLQLAAPESIDPLLSSTLLTTLKVPSLSSGIQLEIPTDASAGAVAELLPDRLSPDVVILAQDTTAFASQTPSHSAADLGNNLVADSTVIAADAETLQRDPNSDSSVGVRPPAVSRALNLWSVRSLKKTVGRKVLDTGVAIAGPQPRDMSENFWTRDYLTGNWGGLRDKLYDSGIDITLAPFIDVFGTIGGGNSQNFAYSSVTTVSFDFYTERMGWWPGGQVHWTNAWIDGGVSVGREFAGAFNSVFFADPPRRGFRLFELWYGQKLFNNQLEVRLGKIYPFVRLAISQVATVFQNSNFGYPGFIGTQPRFGYSTLYGAAPFGLQMLYTPTDSPWFANGIILDGFDDPSPNSDENYRGWDIITLRGNDGIEGMFEVGYRVNQLRGQTGLPGTYRIGAQFHTGEFWNNNRLENGQPRTAFTQRGTDTVGNYAFYFVGEQMLFRESSDPTDRTQGLSAFVKATVAPPGDVNTIGFNVAGGLVYEGPFPGRNRDLIGIGVAHTEFSSGVKEFARNLRTFAPTLDIPSGETSLEFLYAAEIAPWWVVIFSLQYIINPSVNVFGDAPNATVIGISSRFGL